MHKAPRGTFDIFLEKQNLRDDIINKFFEIVKTYGFGPITTPIFEEESLFVRSVGDSSDIVNKEIYQFVDKKGRSLALRPELTASIMRCYIENKMYAQQPIKRFAYYGPAFRYERPQAGRYRQFYQFGVESIGIKNPVYDAQMIIMAVELLRNIDINDFSVVINCLGSDEDRAKYNQALKTYFQQYENQLCVDCVKRLEKNPLRILDCKIDGELDIVKNAPKLKDYLSEESLNYYQEIKNVLDNLEIEYIEDDTLVRGLDYYNDIVFEIKSNSDNAKNTLIGGGRYDNLCQDLGGPSVPSIGFALGVERIIEELLNNNEELLNAYINNIDVYFHCENNDQRNLALPIMELMRDGMIVDCNYEDKSYKSSLKWAIKNNACLLISFIDDEHLLVRNLIQKEEFEISYEQMISDLIKKIEEEYETN